MHIKQSKSYKVFYVLNIVLMILLTVVMVFPYLHILAKAFNDSNDTAKGGLVFWPRMFTVGNFKMLASNANLIPSIRVSVLRAVCGTVLGLGVQFGAAYALSRKKFPGKKWITYVIMIPTFLSAGAIPVYVLYSKMGLLNNFWVYILPTLFSFYNMVIIRSYIENSIPDAIEESALIDGCNEVQIFIKMILPLSKPILATIALWLMVGHWNDYTTTLTYITNPKLSTLQYNMMEMIKESERIQKMAAAAQQSGQVVDQASVPSSDSLISAQVVLTTVPIMCVYPFLQKYFVKGITLGSVKG